MGKRIKSDKSGIDLLEEGVALLRSAPLAVFMRYWIGTIPFILALLFFLADMSRSAYAESRLPGFSLLLAVLFVWMKAWHSAFAAGLRDLLIEGSGERVRTIGIREFFRIATTQAIVQPYGFLFLPLAAIAVIPFPFVYACHQNATCIGSDEAKGPIEVMRRAGRQASLWPGQNWGVHLVLMLFGIFVYLDIVLASIFLPMLAKMFLGIESVFTRGTAAYLNSTYLAATLALAFLCLDPLAKAVYVLRCFEGESLKSGAALRAELRRFRPAAAGRALIWLAFAATALASPAAIHAAEPAAAVAPAELDRSIGETLRHPRYAWRLPRDPLDEAAQPKSWLASFFEGVAEQIRVAYEHLAKLAERFAQWLDRWLESRMPDGGRSFSLPDLSWTSVLLYLIVAVVLAALAVLLFRMWRDRSRTPLMAMPIAPPSALDLHDEQVTADQLPADRWFALAQEMIAAGDFRLAARAIFLACLAALAEGNLLLIRQSKSNLEYAHELNRRAHSRAELLQDFGWNLRAFERVWYGMHAIDRDQLDQTIARYERIRAVVR